MKHTFALSAAEIVNASKWLREHQPPHRNRYRRRIVEFHFAPTEFAADRVVVTCECGKSKDVSDYESW